MSKKPYYIGGSIILASLGLYLYSKKVPASAPAKTQAQPQKAWRPEPAAPAAPSNPFCADGVSKLLGSQKIDMGSAMTSCDGSHTLVMQTDGNLVHYLGGRALWSTRTRSGGKTRFIMQEDGNAVVYDDANTALWASRTPGHPGAYLALQDDGNIVVYGPGQEVLWSSGFGSL